MAPEAIEGKRERSSLDDAGRRYSSPALTSKCSRQGITQGECTATSLKRISSDLRREGEIISVLLSYTFGVRPGV